MLLIERMVLTKLNFYREQANRDRFILPQNKTINYFIDIVSECINFFENKTEKVELIKDEDKKKIIKENNIKLENNINKKPRGRPKKYN